MLLQYLLQHRGRVLSRDLLLGDVWGYRYTGGTRTVDVHVRRLREKLPVLVDALVTVKQFGYKLVDDEARVTARASAPRSSSPRSAVAAAALAARDACIIAVAAAARRARRHRAAADRRGAAHRRAALAQIPRLTPTRPRRRSRPPRPRSIDGRVTLIAADGRVVGDSTQTATRSPRSRTTCERPEVSGARGAAASASVERYSTTVDTDMLYVGGAARRIRWSRYVRVALPLTDVDAAAAARRRRRAARARAGGAGGACCSRGCSRRSLSRRVQAIAAVAQPLLRRATSRGRPTTTATTSSARWRACSTPRCRSWAAASRSCRAIARAWKRSCSGMVEGVLRRRSPGTAAAGEPRRAGDAARRRVGHRPAVPRSDSPSRHRGAAHRGAARRGGREPRAGAARAIPAGRSSRARRRCRAAAAAARCWCCTTSPTCAAPIRSGATSSPTSRTSCARR